MITLTYIYIFGKGNIPVNNTAVADADANNINKKSDV